MTAAIDLDAILDALAARLAPHVARYMGGAANAAALPEPVKLVAESLHWTPRHLKAFCRRQGIAITGTRKCPLVDAGAVRTALAAPATTPDRDRVAELVRRRTGG